MSLGELSGGNLRGYWKLENANDSGANGFNLTASGINYNPSRFTNGADFGSSGTTQYLEHTNNILSSTTQDIVFVSFWFKLNSTANTARTHFLYAINTDNATVNGRYYDAFYTIAGGTITISTRRRITGSAYIIITSSFSVNTSNWYWYYMRWNSTIPTLNHIIYNPSRQVVNANNSLSTAGNSIVGAATPKFSIGTNIGKTLPAWAIIDEFIVSESLYTDNTSKDRVQYFAQANGFWV
jgi:hypothetical protein